MKNMHASNKATGGGGIHWFGLASMSAALLAGLGFALGQHFFYNSLHGKRVPEGSYGMAEFDTGVSKQQVNTAIGTALAFAVKSCLVLAVSTAYVQLFWKALAKQPSNRPFDLHNIDKAYSALRNATLLVDFPGWKRFPLLFILALATWLIPIASIISPATLFVETKLEQPPPTGERYVPTISFDTFSYLARTPGPSDTSVGSSGWGGASQALIRIVTAVGAQGAVLPIDPPSANATWHANFRGPVLRCHSLPANEELEVRQNIGEYLLAQPPWASGSAPWMAYITWSGGKISGYLPYVRFPELFVHGENSAGFGARPENLAFGDYLTTNSTFRVAVLPQALSLGNQAGNVIGLGLPKEEQEKWFEDFLETNNASAKSNNATILECQLFESSYETTFEYVNGNQTVTVDASRTDEDEPFGLPIWALVGPINASCPSFHEPFPDTVFGSEADHPYACDFDPNILRRIAYQTMFEAFNKVIGGPITVDRLGSGNIIKTNLMECEELYMLSDDRIAIQTGNHWLQSSLIDAGYAHIPGLLPPNGNQIRIPLASALEQMFQNFTISLMSSVTFQPNLSDTANLPQTRVTSETYHNVYRYAMIRLWTAYGIAIACATVAVALGVHTIATSGSSYSNEFSTIVRVSRQAHLGHEVDSCDASGRDPLPKYLKRTTFKMSGGSEVESTDLDVKKVTPPASYQPIPHTEQASPHANTW